MGRTKEKKTQERQKMKIGQESEVGGGGLNRLPYSLLKGADANCWGERTAPHTQTATYLSIINNKWQMYQ